MTALRKVKRVLVALVGGAVLVAGVAMVLLPGPAFLVIPAGLAILSFEFGWARRWLQAVRQYVKRRRGSDGARRDAMVHLSVFARLKYRSTAFVGVVVFAFALMFLVAVYSLLVIAGAAFVAIPALLGILNMEFKGISPFLRKTGIVYLK